MPNGERERGRRPDYDVKALDKDSQERMKIGAAWLKDDGSIYIKLERFVTISGGGQFSITAFPVDDEGPFERPRGSNQRLPDDDDAVPRRARPRRSRR